MYYYLLNTILSLFIWAGFLKKYVLYKNDDLVMMKCLSSYFYPSPISSVQAALRGWRCIIKPPDLVRADLGLATYDRPLTFPEPPPPCIWFILRHTKVSSKEIADVSNNDNLIAVRISPSRREVRSNNYQSTNQMNMMRLEDYVYHVIFIFKSNLDVFASFPSFPRVLTRCTTDACTSSRLTWW